MSEWVKTILGWALGLCLVTTAELGRAQGLWPVSPAPLAARLEATAPRQQRRDAARALSDFPPAVVRDVVRRFVLDEDPQVRQILGAIAVRFRYDGFSDVAAAWAQSSRPDERVLAVQLLGLD